MDRHNSEGYSDPTAYEALRAVAREERQTNKKEDLRMKKVFICSRYRADERHTVEEAVSSALSACGHAIQKGYAPIAPHLYIPRCLDDSNPEERAAGMAIGREFLKMCDEVWQWGKTVTEGMAEELAYAKKLGKPIKVFNTHGIPYAQWNTVRFADRLSTEELADLDWVERTNDMDSYYAKWGDENVIDATSNKYDKSRRGNIPLRAIAKAETEVSE